MSATESSRHSERLQKPTKSTKSANSSLPRFARRIYGFFDVAEMEVVGADSVIGYKA